MAFTKLKYFFLDLYITLRVVLVAVRCLVHQLLARHRFATDLKVRKDQVAIVTGGNRGIGFEVVKQLMRLHMHVIIGCRNPADTVTLLEDLRSDYPDGKVEAMKLDLCSLISVRQFVEKFLATGLPLHLLINNAGIMMTPYTVTSDGFESQFHVNYLSHFLLTHLLLPKLKTTGSADQFARIINVSSSSAFPGRIDFENLQSTKYYSSYGCYSQSKLAQIMFTWSLQEQLSQEGAPVTVNTLHPGVIYSDLYRHVKWFRFTYWLVKIIFKTIVHGADGVVYLAASPSIEGVGGKYYDNCEQCDPPKSVLNGKIRKQLWEESCSLVELKL